MNLAFINIDVVAIFAPIDGDIATVATDSSIRVVFLVIVGAEAIVAKTCNVAAHLRPPTATTSAAAASAEHEERFAATGAFLLWFTCTTTTKRRKRSPLISDYCRCHFSFVSLFLIPLRPSTACCRPVDI